MATTLIPGCQIIDFELRLFSELRAVSTTAVTIDSEFCTSHNIVPCQVVNYSDWPRDNIEYVYETDIITPLKTYTKSQTRKMSFKCPNIDLDSIKTDQVFFYECETCANSRGYISIPHLIGEDFPEQCLKSIEIISGTLAANF